MKKLLLSLMIAATCFSGEMAWGKENAETMASFSRMTDGKVDIFMLWAKCELGYTEAWGSNLENLEKYNKNAKAIANDLRKELKKRKKVLEAIIAVKDKKEILKLINDCLGQTFKGALDGKLSDDNKNYYGGLGKSRVGPPELNADNDTELGSKLKQFAQTDITVF